MGRTTAKKIKAHKKTQPVKHNVKRANFEPGEPRESPADGLLSVQECEKLPLVDGIIDWKSIYTLNVKYEDMHNIYKGALVGSGSEARREEWQFGHLNDTILRLKKENPTKNLFLFGCQPFTYGNQKISIDESGNSMVTMCPSIAITVIAKGYEPPPHFALQKYGHDSICHFRKLKLSWEPVKHMPGVYILEQNRRSCDESQSQEQQSLLNEYSTLFTMKPSKEWARKEDGTLDIGVASFKYPVDGEVVDEDYTKGESSFADFCIRFDLNVDEHKPLVKEAVRQGFNKARAEIEGRIKLLHGYPPHVLDEMSVVKIFPRNTCVTETDRNFGAYINKFYGKSQADL